MKNCVNIKNKFISKSRLAQYDNINEYIENLKLSNKFYIPLSIVEISLRNSLNSFFIERIGKDWIFDKTFIKPQLQSKIDTSIKILKQQNKVITQDNIIAELSFGFWIMLLKKPFQEYLRYKDLKEIFPNIIIEKDIKVNRHYIFTKLNKIRLFRNKVFHFDKIINKSEYINIKNDIYLILQYFDDKLYEFAKDKDCEHKND